MFSSNQNLPVMQMNLFTMGCEGAERVSRPATGGSSCLAEVCLLESKSKAIIF